MSGAERRLFAREWFLSAVVAAVLAGVLLWLGPPGVDLAAHAYQRTFLLQHGFAVWNNFWYAGRYSFVTYSFIYYPLAAVLGIKLLAMLSIGIAALAFALVVWQEWGPSARFSSRTFAILWPGIVLSAAFPFALGAMFALLALAALQRGHRRSFAVLLFLTLLASPLALLLLVLVLAGGALGPTPRRATVVVIAAAVALELVLRRLFPEQGQFPFSVADLIPGVAFGVLGIAVTARVPGARTAVRPLRRSSSPRCSSRSSCRAISARTSSASSSWRSRSPCSPRRSRRSDLCSTIPLVVVGGFWNISPLAHTARAAGADPAHSAAYWQPAIGFLRHNLSPSYRVEAVDTVEHWPAAYLPDAGIPIVRGWYRQNDFPQNELLYDRTLAARAYESWLRGLGVRYVVLSDAPPDYSSRGEAALIRSGRSGLEPVFRAGT